MGWGIELQVRIAISRSPIEARGECLGVDDGEVLECELHGCRVHSKAALCANAPLPRGVGAIPARPCARKQNGMRREAQFTGELPPERPCALTWPHYTSIYAASRRQRVFKVSRDCATRRLSRRFIPRQSPRRKSLRRRAGE